MPASVTRTALLPLLFTLLAALGIVATAAHAAPVETVTNLDDAGAGSLRQAVADVDAGGAVAFAPLLSGTITLTSGELALDDAVTIDGPGAQELAISGNDSSRIFAVTAAGDVELSGLTLTHGRVVSDSFADVHGGAVHAAGGRLTIRDSRITDNAVTNVVGGSSAFGGGVSVTSGALVMERVALTNNTATGPLQGHGGGLMVHSWAGAVTLRNVTVAGNRAGTNSGGILVGNGNGGGAVVLEQVTIAGNSAPSGGGLATTVATTVVDSIVAGNTAAVAGPDCWTGIAGSFVSAGANVLESTGDCVTSGSGTLIVGEDPLLGPLALNGPGGTETLAPGAGSPALDAAPLSGDGACPPPATDQRGVARPQGAACDLGAFEARAASPRLDPGIADFGGISPPYESVGPMTVRLHNDGELPLELDSFALAGADADQFELGASDCGASVAAAAWCDTEVSFDPTTSGQKSARLAFESPAGDFDMTVTGRAFAAQETVTTLADDGPGSLRQALADLGPYGTIRFADGLTGTIRLTSGEITVRNNVTIDGPGAQRLAISGDDSTRIFTFDRDVPNIVLSGLTLRDGLAQPSTPSFGAWGGAIYKSGDGRLTIRDSRLVDNRVATTTASAAYGGAIALIDGELTLERVSLAGNRAESTDGLGLGGAIDAGFHTDAITLRNVTLTGNVATGGDEGRGGALRAGDLTRGPPIVVEQTTIAGNSATSGGGIYTTEPGVRLVDSVVADNAAGDCATVASGSLELRGKDLIEDATGCTTSGAGTLISGEDPLLGPLALNGPGETETMALGAGSPALDAAPLSGDGACPPPATDQRGVERPQGAACDLGAFEARPAVASLAPASLEFGARLAGGGASEPLALTLANGADADLPLARETVALAGTAADQFTLDTGGCPAVLAPGADCELAATFAPTRVGALAAEVSAGAASAALRGS
ncbi:choice-of-anchor Q domain-containing protein, partial [Conexibacter stalactiti]